MASPGAATPSLDEVGRIVNIKGERFHAFAINRRRKGRHRTLCQQLNEENEEQRQKRIGLYSTIIGIFTAAFTAIIVGLLAWALTSIISGTHYAAVEAAKQETVRLLQSPPILQQISSTTERANVASVTASASAAEARVEATQARAEATEADLSLKTLRTTIASTTAVASALQDVNKFVDNIAKNPEFQSGVVDKLTHVISTNIDPLRLSVTELQKPSTLSVVTSNRALGQVFGNTTGKTMIVIVTAFNRAKGNTMCGNVAKSSNELPAGTSGGNSTTTVQSSFIDDRFSASIAFVVPTGYFYNVSTDGGSETLVAWTEVIL
jgi:hypothetical protein